MIGWLRGVWLRAGAMNVLLKEFKVPMATLEGPLKPIVSEGVRLARLHNGNAYDAASTIMAIAVRALSDKSLGNHEADAAMLYAPSVAVRLMPLMNLPEAVASQWTVAQEGRKRG